MANVTNLTEYIASQALEPRKEWSCDLSSRGVFARLLKHNKARRIDSHYKVTVDELLTLLSLHGFIRVHCYKEVGTMDDWMSHSFVLEYKDGNIYRYESYMNEFPLRLVKWPNCREDLETIVRYSPERLTQWNLIFGVTELVDTNKPFYLRVDAPTL